MPASPPSETSSTSTSKPAALCPAQVHPQHHLGPVLRVGTAGTGVYLRDGVPLVVLTGEQAAQLELFERLGNRHGSVGELALELRELAATLLDGHQVQGLGVGEVPVEGAQALDVVADPAVLRSHLPGLVGVRPEVRFRDGLLECSEAFD